MPIYLVINGPTCSSAHNLRAPPPSRGRSRSPGIATPRPAISPRAPPRPLQPPTNERPRGYQMTLEESFQNTHRGRESPAQQQQQQQQQQQPSFAGPVRTHSQPLLQDRPRDRPPPDPAREYRVLLADGIIQSLREKQYHTPDGRVHHLSQRNRMLEYQSKYYAPGDPLLQKWAIPPAQQQTVKTQFHFEPRSTLDVAREWATPRADGTIWPVGVLNFASAKRRGGGFRSGAQAQEESLARASNLIYALEAPVSEPFYSLHAKERQGGRGGYYTHAMIYSGSVTLMRNDRGEFAEPLNVSMLTSAAVNAGDVRRKSAENGLQQSDVERTIEIEMRERMGRVLRVFEEKKDRVLILGSFGTGVFQNSVPMVAGIWAQHLAPGGRFYGSFDHVVFAILGDGTFQQFKDMFKEMEGVMAVSALDVNV
ncbi:hypothetical protein FRB94_004443 [Tulasnella sp. JGI-2019a]|nr:hypothetical protein FRB93_003599 [Tulasnella sp. JGI-2019a]KAG9001911.1 hypothetical protein FRB94_004443 [Tulasnella sp. JGI-2019a]KAG9029339.1 hypothetical protein FRB95_005455 [Tulasnella sp. JGI-2019a]